MPMLNEPVTKNIPIKKIRPFFVFMEVVHLPRSQVSLQEDKKFRYKVLNKCFNFLVNFSLILSALKRSQGKSKLIKVCSRLF